MNKIDKIINSTIVKHTTLIQEYLDCNDDEGESMEDYVANFDLRRMLSLAAFFDDYRITDMLVGVTVITVIKSEYFDNNPVSFVVHISHVDASIYVRRTGMYYSYDGIEWDDEIEEVFPVEVMVTKFKNAQGCVYTEST